MFHKAVLKMTFIYLTIIMFISLFFSLNLYHISTQEIDRGLRRQQLMFEGIDRDNGFIGAPEILRQRDFAFAEGKERVLSQLIYTNLFILILVKTH
ncbi:hypothetical protein COX95_03625 [bacterium CG_4_10_14_0_2_um_filter_33_32]|nr:MAG: hypothetical protein AUJ93_02095 [bacterium CG2_30_33_46]PIR67909.1 MAG: hypothetical protein COU50_00770 [bacterium CG10_big_fil_rev_8_21_14_0_10_33_18]PIU76915.1 MAG: hypothetical protein COS74_01600 [bacterium CG06_land_8_20_14_3_00_33_50]PIW81491.1 MAG: hypothetical protein COZ97_01550 [bacterium CG_4_8_14_3_um_filter_33_28]PIY85668.1 MAG: hypothetical protein COY76_00925 [bacterium CG_4_10_14_0_8_um_filter_33_57]PIZ85570.1 MAG: hypothetical protein COX95_03625 [bacterium CG_4_10_1